MAFSWSWRDFPEKMFASLYSEHPDIVNKTLLLEGVHYIRILLYTETCGLTYSK